jgi:hypothetical protein
VAGIGCLVPAYLSVPCWKAVPGKPRVLGETEWSWIPSLGDGALVGLEPERQVDGLR